MDDTDMIGQAMSRAGVDLEAVDLFRVASILRPLFPEHSQLELARKAAEIAVAGGCRLFIWEPPCGR